MRRPAQQVNELMYHVYVLRSLKDGKTYAGYSKDLKVRLRMHDNGRVLATKYRRPLELLISENFETSADAKKRELWWKSSNGRRRLKEFFKKSL